MSKHLALVGGGHAHMTTLLNLGELIRSGHRVTLISPSPYHYYSGMGPGMLAGSYRPEEIRFNVKKMAEDRGAAFMEGKAARIDPGGRRLLLDSGEEVNYDVVSFNIGSEIPVDLLNAPEENVYTVKPIVNLLSARRAALDHLKKGGISIAVIGGGPAGIEVAGNAWRLVRDAGGEADITLMTRGKLMPGFPEKVRSLALSSFGARGIRVEESARADRFENRKIILSGGGMFPFDLAFLAVGTRPPPLFLDSGMPAGEDGGLLVNDHLQSVAYPEIFGGGDCVTLNGRKLARVGVYALRQNPVLYNNIRAFLSGGKLVPFDPGGPYLLIFNLGDGRGIFCRKSLVFDGQAAFFIKNHIDRKFMKTFQVSGETLEESPQI